MVADSSYVKTGYESLEEEARRKLRNEQYKEVRQFSVLDAYLVRKF